MARVSPYGMSCMNTIISSNEANRIRHRRIIFPRISINIQCCDVVSTPRSVISASRCSYTPRVCRLSSYEDIQTMRRNMNLG